MNLDYSKKIAVFLHIFEGFLEKDPWESFSLINFYFFAIFHPFRRGPEERSDVRTLDGFAVKNLSV